MPALNIDTQHLARLRDHFARYGAIPSYAGIGELMGFKGKAAAAKLARRLTDAGYLRSAPGGKLAPASRFFELPFVDAVVRAGLPESIEAQQVGSFIPLESYLTDEPSNTVLVRVRGDSMRDAAILDGDLAVVERTSTAQPGQFVVAVVDGDFTLKELRFEGKQPVLFPHNRDYASIRPRHALEIFGVVRGVVRRYGSSNSKHKISAPGEST